MPEPTDAPDAPEMPGAGTELAVPSTQIMGDDELRRAWRIASALAQSGMFKDAQQAEQAMAKIIVGHGLGLGPAQAMTGIHIVEGKPELAAVILANFVRSRDGYDYDVTEHDGDHCKIEFFGPFKGEPFQSRGMSEFTQDDAQQADLTKPTKSGKPSNYTKYPRNMLFARAMSNGVKWLVPEVTGGMPVYFTGELDQRELVGGSSDPEPIGIELGPKVEEVLARASELGHAGLSDRATTEMAVGGMSPKDVEAWVGRAHTELNALEAGRPGAGPAAVTDAEEVCGAKHPAVESVWCDLPVGHSGPHVSGGSFWDRVTAADDAADAKCPEHGETLDEGKCPECLAASFSDFGCVCPDRYTDCPIHSPERLGYKGEPTWQSHADAVRKEGEAQWQEPSAPTHPVPSNAGPSPEPGAGLSVQALREKANALLDQAIEARESGDEVRADDLQAEAEALNDAAEAAENPAQEEMGI